jgi:hypothetical protein
MADNQKSKAMKKLLILLAVYLMATSMAISQGTIKGAVKTKTLREGKEIIEPLISAEVYVKYAGTIIKAMTNNHGEYTLKPLEPGTYSITVVSFLIDTVTIPNISVTNSGLSYLHDLVVPLGRSIGKVTIIADTPLKDESPSKSELKPSDIKNMPDPNLNKMIEVLGGTYVSDDGRQISFRGARIGDALYIIDGVRQRGTDVSLPNRSIGSINTWHGGVPAEYGDFMGGVVVIETMSYFDYENQLEVKRLMAKKQAEAEQFLDAIEEKEE